MYNFKEYLRSTLREAFGDFGTKVGAEASTNINYMSGRGGKGIGPEKSLETDEEMDIRILCQEIRDAQRRMREQGCDQLGTARCSELCARAQAAYDQLCGLGHNEFCDIQVCQPGQGGVLHVNDWDLPCPKMVARA